MRSFIRNLFYICALFLVAIVINFACCDAKRLNEETERYRKNALDTVISKRNGLQQNNRHFNGYHYLHGNDINKRNYN